MTQQTENISIIFQFGLRQWVHQIGTFPENITEAFSKIESDYNEYIIRALCKKNTPATLQRIMYTICSELQNTVVLFTGCPGAQR